jgi:hypothetical protein
MAEIFNLRQARKTKARAEKEKTAQANRVLHGTPKALRKLQEARRDKAQKRLEQHHLQDRGDDK